MRCWSRSEAYTTPSRIPARFPAVKAEATMRPIRISLRLTVKAAAINTTNKDWKQLPGGSRCLLREATTPVGILSGISQRGYVLRACLYLAMMLTAHSAQAMVMNAFPCDDRHLSAIVFSVYFRLRVRKRSSLFAHVSMVA